MQKERCFLSIPYSEVIFGIWPFSTTIWFDGGKNVPPMKRNAKMTNNAPNWWG